MKIMEFKEKYSDLINEIDIRDYLVENNYPQGLINILDDYFTNKAKQIKGYTVATNCN